MTVARLPASTSARRCATPAGAAPKSSPEKGRRPATRSTVRSVSQEIAIEGDREKMRRPPMKASVVTTGAIFALLAKRV
jgi:hypothetical protein